jgi:uncharacterized protein (TIGR02996 family)
MTTLEALQAAVRATPDDDARRFALADYAAEHGLPDVEREQRLAVALRRILVEPDADTPRLEYADLCERFGNDTRADFIRVSCELAQIPHPNANNECSACGVPVGSQHEPGCRYVELRNHQRGLWAIDSICYFGQGQAFWEGIGVTPELDFTDRGFLYLIEVELEQFVDAAAHLLWEPTRNTPFNRNSPFGSLLQPIRVVRITHHDALNNPQWIEQNIGLPFTHPTETHLYEANMARARLRPANHPSAAGLTYSWPSVRFELMPMPELWPMPEGEAPG